MNKNKIEEWLRDISTPTGLSYSGDRTLSDSEVDCIIYYINELEQKDKEIERLNNIINEYEMWLNDLGAWTYLEKLKELKESGNNE